MSYYQIVKDKIFFSDRRMDAFYEDVYSVFRLFDAVDGSYTPPACVEELARARERIELLKKLRIKVDDCCHKAFAVRYALALIEQETLVCPTAEELKNYSEMIGHKMCREAELKNDVLIYETEAFLFQVRSNMDMIMQLLKHVYPYLDKKKGDDCESFKTSKDDKWNTVDLMRGNGDTDMANFFQKQVDEWFTELNKMRNMIAHRSGLIEFKSVVFKSETEEVVKPKMPNEKNVDEYCRDIFRRLMEIYKTVAEEFVLPKLR